MRPDERSRLPLVLVALLLALIAGLLITAAIVVVRSDRDQAPASPTADISRLTVDMLLDESDVPALPGGVWGRELNDARPDATAMKVTPPECASPINQGARQIGTAGWKTARQRYGVTLGVPSTADSASLHRWVTSCGTFQMAGVTRGSVRPMTASGVPDWAVAYTLTVGEDPDRATSAGVIGVHRGVMVSAFCSFRGPLDRELCDRLPGIFTAAVMRLDKF